MDEDDLPVLQYVDGAEEVLSAIAELPGVDWTLTGRIHHHEKEKPQPVRILVRTGESNDQELLIMFPTRTADQFFVVSLPNRGDRLAYIERIAECIRSFGYDCITATKFLKTKSRSVTPWSLQERGPTAAPFFPPLGDTMKKKLKPNHIVTPDKRAELDRDGRALFQAAFDTPGVANVRVIGIKANVCGDTKPVIINGKLPANLILTCYSPQTEYTLQVTRGGATNADELRRKIERRIGEVKFAAPIPPPPRPPAAPVKPVQAIEPKPKREERNGDWSDDHIAAIKCLVEHAEPSEKGLRVRVPGGCLRDVWPDKPTKRNAIYTTLVNRNVLTDPREISGPKRKSFALVLPAIPGVTWNSASTPAPVPTPAAPPPTPPPTPPPPEPKPEPSVTQPPPPSTEPLNIHLETWMADGLQHLIREAAPAEEGSLQQTQFATGQLKAFYMQTHGEERAASLAEEAVLHFKNTGVFISASPNGDPRGKRYWIANVRIMRWEHLDAFTKAVDSVPEPVPPPATLESLTQDELQSRLHELNLEVVRRGWTLLIHNGEVGIFFPLDSKPKPAESP